MLVVVVEESLGPEMGRDVDAGMEGAVPLLCCNAGEEGKSTMHAVCRGYVLTVWSIVCLV